MSLKKNKSRQITMKSENSKSEEINEEVVFTANLINHNNSLSMILILNFLQK